MSYLLGKKYSSFRRKIFFKQCINTSLIHQVVFHHSEYIIRVVWNNVFTGELG